jgi:hypothetical protein
MSLSTRYADRSSSGETAMIDLEWTGSTTSTRSWDAKVSVVVSMPGSSC